MYIIILEYLVKNLKVLGVEQSVALKEETVLLIVKRVRTWTTTGTEPRVVRSPVYSL